MKNKIVGIVVLMLVATTVVSATNGLIMKEKSQPKTLSVDVPVWKKGDSWTYNYHRTEYRYNGSTMWYKDYNNCSLTLTVSDDSGANYTVKYTQKNTEGRITIGSYQLKYTKLTKFSDEIILRKNDLGQLRQTAQTKGPVFWLIGGKLPFPAQFQFSGTESFTPAYVILPFPFSAGDSGTLPAYHGEYGEKCVLYWGLITLFDHPSAPYNQGTLPYQCEMANVTVPAGTYTTYNVSVDVTWGMHGHYIYLQYYVPDVGNTVKWSVYQVDSAGNLQYNIGAELVSTTHAP
jgi:hypothetical protein